MENITNLIFELGTQSLYTPHHEDIPLHTLTKKMGRHNELRDSHNCTAYIFDHQVSLPSLISQLLDIDNE